MAVPCGTEQNNLRSAAEEELQQWYLGHRLKPLQYEHVKLHDIPLLLLCKHNPGAFPLKHTQPVKVLVSPSIIHKTLNRDGNFIVKSQQNNWRAEDLS